MAPATLNPVLKVIRNYRFWIIVALFVGGIILHYPQQLPFWGVETPSSSLGLTRHTIERVYLLAPIIYAGFTFGIKGGIASSAVALGIMLPRAILISPSQADALFETAGVISVGAAVNLIFHMHRREREHSRVSHALLKAEEEKWRSSFDALEDMMLIIDRDYNIENINDSGLALLGKSREEIIGEKCYQALSGRDSPIEECPCRRALESKQVESLEWYEERLGRYFSIKSAPILDENGEVVKFVDLRRDITELKRAEEMLAKIVDGSSISSFVINRNHKVTHWNTAIEALTGIKEEKIVGTDEQWRAFWPEKRPVMADLIVDGAPADEMKGYYKGKCHKCLLIDGAYEAEGFYPALGRGGKWLHFTASPIKGPDGEIIGAIETLQDITERKRAEGALNERVKELQCLYDITNIAQRPGITLDELYQEVANLLPSAWQYSEIACAQITINNKRFETENYRESEWKQSSDIKVHRKRVGVVEVNYLEEQPDAEEGPFLKEERLLIDAVAERLGTITERKGAEKALRRSEEKYRSLISNIPDVAWTSDENCRIVFISPNIERITGYTQEEEYQVGDWMKWFDRLHPDDVEHAKAVFREFIKGGKPYDIEYRLKRKDGRWVWINERALGTYEKDGKLYADGLISDVTERKRAEENLRYYLQEITRAQEEERKRIARELHDSTAQTLIALLHQLENLLGDKAALPVREAKALWAFYEQIRDVLREVRRFSRDLRPSILDDLGLLPALEWVTGELNRAYGIKTTLNVVGSERRFSPEAELLLFRIVQETLRNVAKHAQASRTEVKFAFSKQKIQVTISDDGIGFQPPENLGELLQAGKLGLAGMEERIRLLNGSMSIESKRGKGTKVMIEVPI